MNETLKKHLVSFAWRLGGMIAVVILEQISELMLSIGLSQSMIVIVGLAVGELTKYINVNIIKANK